MRLSYILLNLTRNKDPVTLKLNRKYWQDHISDPKETYGNDSWKENNVFENIDNEMPYENATITALGSTIVMSTEMTSEEPKHDELMWKLICIIFIILTTFLLILSICLWRSLPRNAKSCKMQENPSISKQAEPTALNLNKSN